MQSKAGLSLRTSAVQHRVAVRADDCEVGEPGFASLGQVRDWLRVMTLGEVPPDFSVDSKEIKCADLAFKPARYFQSFLFLSVYHYQRPVPFPESMLAGKHPALNECFVIIFESLFHHSMKLAFSGRANGGSVSAVDALSGQRAFIDAGVLRFQPRQTRDLSQVGNCDFLEKVRFRCHKATARNDQD